MNQLISAFDSLLPWAEKGEKGDKGDMGEPGVPGEQGTPGATGAKGDTGRMPYPAGAWSETTTYTADERVAPYVMFGTQYYVLSKQITLIGGETPAADWAANGANANWQLMDKYKALFAEILIADMGKIGSAVFSENCLFSQYGLDANGAPVTSPNGYQGFPDGTFIPHILFNFLTGVGHLAAGAISWDTLGRLHRKTHDIIDWRVMSHEIPDTATEYDFNLARGTYIWTGSEMNSSNTPYINLPDPDVNDGALIECAPPMTRLAIYYYRIRCKSKPILYNGQPAILSEINYGANAKIACRGGRWYADSGFFEPEILT